MSSTTTTFSDVHPDIVEAQILGRLDGPTLAFASCASSQLHSSSQQDHIWTTTCHSTWPSTSTPLLRHLISTFPCGPRSYFSLSFPLLLPTTTAAGPNFRRRHPLQEQAHINRSPRDRDLDRVVPVLPFQNRPLGHQRRHPHDRMPPRQRRSLCRTGGGDKSELGSDRPGRPEGGEPLKPEGRIGGAPLADRRGSGTVRFDPRRREPERTHVGVGAVRDSGDVRWWIGGGGWDDASKGGEFAGGEHEWNAVDGEG
ncbi:hypothetical protein CsSME_00037869 [Camellia sinensis var. sinensis]